MSRFFNVDIDKIISDYELSYKKANDIHCNEHKRLNDNYLNIFSQKKEEHTNKMKQISDLKNKVSEHHEKLQDLNNTIECVQQTVNTEIDRLECINNESRLLEVKENDLQNTINEKETELNKIITEKKELLKKFKKEFKTFKTGVNIYEQFLQLSMNIKNEGQNKVINLGLRNLNIHTNYNVIFEEHDDYFKLIDITPHSNTVIQAAKLYNQNKDVQGLLAFLYKAQE